MALTEAEELELLELEEQEAQTAPSATESVAPAQETPTEPATPAEPQRTDLEAAKNVLSSARNVLSVNPFQTVKNIATGTASGLRENPVQTGKDVLQLTSAPFRGVRGAAVGLGRLGSEPVQRTLQRASEATSPDFKPETGPEKLATASSALLEIAAPLGQGGRASKLGRAATELGTLKGAKAGVAALKTKAGINIERAVEPLSKKAATPLVNALTNMKKSGALKKLPLQDLHEAETQLRNLLDAERVGGFARILGKKPAGRLTDQGVALASRVKEAVIKEQNLRIKGLEVARRRVGDVATRNRIRNIILGTLGAKAASNLIPGAGTAAQIVQAGGQ